MLKTCLHTSESISEPILKITSFIVIRCNKLELNDIVLFATDFTKILKITCKISFVSSTRFNHNFDNLYNNYLVYLSKNYHLFCTTAMPKIFGVDVDRELLGLIVNFGILMVLLAMMWMILKSWESKIN